jgi:hypothetical protein
MALKMQNSIVIFVACVFSNFFVLRGEFTKAQMKYFAPFHSMCFLMAPKKDHYPQIDSTNSGSICPLSRKVSTGPFRLNSLFEDELKLRGNAKAIRAMGSLKCSASNSRAVDASLEEKSSDPLLVSRFCWREACRAYQGSFQGTLMLSIPNADRNVLMVLQRLMNEFSSSRSSLDERDQIDWEVRVSDENQLPALFLTFTNNLTNTSPRSSFRPFELDIATVRMKRWVKRVIIG